MTSMNEMPDNELDDLFRKSAEEIDIPFDPEAWLRMEKKLDNGSSNGNGKWKRWGLLALLLLLISTGAYIWLSGAGNGNLVSQNKKGLPDTLLAKDNRPNYKERGQIERGQIERGQIERGQIERGQIERGQIERGQIERGQIEKRSNTPSLYKDKTLSVNKEKPGTVNSDKKAKSTKVQKDKEVLYTENEKNKNTSSIDANRKSNSSKKGIQTSGKTINDSEEEPQPEMVAPIRTAEISKRDRSTLSDSSRVPAADKKLRRFFSSEETKKGKVADQQESKIALNGQPGSVEAKNVLTEKGDKNKGEKQKGSGSKRNQKKTLIVKSTNGQPMDMKPEETSFEADTHTHRLYTTNYLANKEEVLYLMPLTGKSIQVNWAKGKDFVIPPPPADTMGKAGEKPDIKPLVERKPFRLGIRFVVAPDLTTVGFRNFMQPGTSAGILLEYNITNRLLITAGGIYSKKIYVAGKDDYNPPDDYLDYMEKQGFYLNSISADCRIIDIPLNLRYNVIQNKTTGSNWFVSAGASSYLMKREDYDYHFDKHGYGKDTKWGISNSNNHFFAVGNLSIGYERRMGDYFSWQVEPYLKIPLGGVGYGKVKLISSGAFFSIKYHLSKQK
ncbi:hypothetical protein QNI19_11560 [Cytophagaceae bacterium DM2B3-1]|uniref:Outer membrane protein beta-barrel domain-containing protein n=1 Tax=Xanthocytophaga flava TaxID=3048013 RepID=A0ABT7CIP3_9BACT|nr:hypothetical protein [Xanthocytophaga flavus]MDJ1493572.1 hypothetical protein [Xanthocytophaga flavus]